MRILVSFLSTNYKQLKEHWDQHSVLISEGKRGSDRPFSHELGGRIEIINWSTKTVEWAMRLESPSGLHKKSSELIFVNSIKLGRILVVSIPKKEIVSAIDNRAFNKPHSLVKTNSGFMVACTGVDAIVEVTEKGQAIFSIFLTEHGYEIDQMGLRRIVDKESSHQGVEYPSLSQTTHVNYARYTDRSEKKIVATLFHPGELVEIDKLTKDIKVVMGGLKNPHNLKPAGDNYILCNTSANCILILNQNYEICREIGLNCGMSWVQDAIWIPTSNSILAIDSDNHRLVEFNAQGSVVDEYYFSSEYRMYEVSIFDAH